MIDSHYVCTVDGTMEQCMAEIEVEDLGDHIYFGPQGDILEQVNIFNRRYRSNLDITKTFKWKRGSYKIVAEAVNEMLGFNRKPSGMYNFMSREDYFRQHSWNSMQAMLRGIDRMLYTARYNGEMWLEDPSILVERKNVYSNYVCEKDEIAQSLIDNLDNMEYMRHRMYVAERSRTNQRYKLVSTLRMTPDAMKIYITKGRSSAEAAKHIENIACDMDIELNIVTYPLKDMTRNSSFTNPRFDVMTYGNVIQHDDRGYLAFPYISGSRYGSNNEFGQSVCYGDDATNFNTSLRKFDLPSYVMQCINWSTSYTNETGPHNNIKTMYHGEPSRLSDEYRKVFGTNSVDTCSYEPTGREDYCDMHECRFRSSCTRYLSVHKEPISPEDAEQLTLQWATRMGGVNHGPTIIHSVDDGGQPTVSIPASEQAIQGNREQDRNAQWNPEELRQQLDARNEEGNDA